MYIHFVWEKQNNQQETYAERKKTNEKKQKRPQYAASVRQNKSYSPAVLLLRR